MTQVPPRQASDFCAPIPLPAIVTVTPVIPDDVPMENCRAAACAPPEEDTEIGTVTDPPAIPEPDPKESVTFWPNNAVPNPKKNSSLRTPSVSSRVARVRTGSFWIKNLGRESDKRRADQPIMTLRGNCALSSRNVFLRANSALAGWMLPLTSVARETRVCSPGVAPVQ